MRTLRRLPAKDWSHEFETFYRDAISKYPGRDHSGKDYQAAQKERFILTNGGIDQIAMTILLGPACRTDATIDRAVVEGIHVLQKKPGIYLKGDHHPRCGVFKIIGATFPLERQFDRLWNRLFGDWEIERLDLDSFLNENAPRE